MGMARDKLVRMVSLETLLTVEYATQLHALLSPRVASCTPEERLLLIKLGEALNARDGANAALASYDSAHRAIL